MQNSTQNIAKIIVFLLTKKKKKTNKTTGQTDGQSIKICIGYVYVVRRHLMVTLRLPKKYSDKFIFAVERWRLFFVILHEAHLVNIRCDTHQ